jgi:hypothetical protein
MFPVVWRLCFSVAAGHLAFTIKHMAVALCSHDMADRSADATTLSRWRVYGRMDVHAETVSVCCC